MHGPLIAAACVLVIAQAILLFLHDLDLARSKHWLRAFEDARRPRS
jgi:hypothetical protein